MLVEAFHIYVELLLIIIDFKNTYQYFLNLKESLKET